MQPRAPRRISCGQLVTGKVLDKYIDAQLSVTCFEILDADTRALRLKKVHRSLRGGTELRGQRSHAQVLAIVAENPLHEEVCPNKRVMPRALAQLSEERGDWSLFFHLGHMARLATAFAGVIAVLPLLVRHLLGQSPGGFAVLAQGSCVQRVAGSAKSRIANLRAFFRKESSGRALHYPLMARIDNERPMLGPPIRRLRRVDYEIADVTGWSAKVLFGDLVTHRAGDAVRRFCIVLLIRIEWKAGEDIHLLLLRVCVEVRHGHVAMRTFVLDLRCRRWMVNRLPPHASLPVRIARGVGHDACAPIEPDGIVCSRLRFHAVVASHAAVGCLKILRGRGTPVSPKYQEGRSNQK